MPYVPLGMPSSSAVPLLAQPFFKIATPSPSARTSSAQVSSSPQASTPDLEREELEKFQRTTLLFLLLHLQQERNPLNPLLRLQLLNRRLRD